MTIWHIMGLFVAVVGYRTGNKIIQEKYQNNGVSYRGFFFQHPARLYRDGADAVAIGKITRYASLFFLMVVITDMIGVHNLTLYVFVADIIIYNTIIFILYPIKSDPPR
jgi:hypothetical protein